MREHSRKPVQPERETAYFPTRFPTISTGRSDAGVLSNVETADADAEHRFAHDFSGISAHSTQRIPLQAKLSINAPGDIYEQEADRVAEQVTSASASVASPNPDSADEDATRENDSAGDEMLRTKRVAAHDFGERTAPPAVHDALRSSSQPLDSSTRKFMESRFGHDFSGVRVHTDAGAADAASAVNARAFTVAGSIVFGNGEYAPQTGGGRKLLAHELTHVVQQRSGSTGSAQHENPAQTVSPVLQKDDGDPQTATTTTAATAATPTTITLSKGVGAKGPNVVSDLKAIQGRLLEMGFLATADKTTEGDTLLKDLKDTDVVTAASIPKTIDAIREYERVVQYQIGSSRYNRPTGQISPGGSSLALMNAQIAKPTATELAAITASRAGLSATTVVAGELTLAGKVGDVSDGNQEADLIAVQQRLAGMGKLSAAKMTLETPATIRSNNPESYKDGKTNIDKAHIPETVKAIKDFQTNGQFTHTYWKTRTFAGQDLSGLKWEAGIVAEGDMSEFILSHYQKVTYSFNDAAGKNQSMTEDNFEKTPYTTDAAGIGTAGTAATAGFTVDEFKAYGITDLEARALLFVSQNEGKFNALNTYDRAVVSFGFVQFAGGSGGGTFPIMMGNLKMDSPTVFSDKFGKYGIDVEYVVSGGSITSATVVAIDPVAGTVMRGQAAEQYIRNTPKLAGTFLAAGNDKDVQKAQVKTAVNNYVIPSRSLKFSDDTATSFLKYTIDKKEVLLVGKAADDFAQTKDYADMPAADKGALTPLALTGESISDYLSSEKSRAVIIDQSINMGLPNAAGKISKGMKSYIESSKEIAREKLKTATETDILASFQPFAFVPARVRKAIDDASLSGT
ncbi:MAG: LysM repeat-containing protein [Chlorobi bacterium]|nr:LysM repeat-containing protein [Chlorobiota bacterium]